VEILVIVNDSPLRSHSSQTALRFCKAATAKGHTVKQVFFYLDGVYQQLDVSIREPDEPNILTSWRDYADASGTELVVCTAASHRRIPGTLPAGKPFRDGSLIEMLDLSTRVDRMLSFGGP
jgi:tRNA 2-thiouridine synthesizing protein D